MTDYENLYLVYIEPIGKNLLDWYEYEFIFSETPDIVWGNDWDCKLPLYCTNLRPEESTYSLTKRLKTNIPLKVIQENSCFSIEMATYNIVALGWEDITNYESYPEDGRLIFNFGESYISIENKLSKRHQLFIE